VSRAYYAAHNIARQKKFSRDGILLTDDKHQRVLNYFFNYDDANGTHIASPLDSLRILRGDADYDEDVRISLASAQLAIFEAQDIIEEIAGIS